MSQATVTSSEKAVMGEFRRGWGALLAATVGTLCGLITATNYTQGFFVGPVIEELGWTPGQFFLSYTVLMLTGLVTAPVIGSLAPKIGLRTLGVIGLAGHAIGYVLISLNTGSLVLWYASFALLAVLAAGSLPIIWTAGLNGWFIANRGKAIGITMAGTGIGAFVLPPIVEFLIANYGWRAAYQGIGVGLFAFSLPIVLVLFRENKEPPAGTRAAAPAAAWGMTREEALRHHKFWILGAVLFLTVIVLVGLLSNFERILSSKGLERDQIAAIAAVLGATVVIGRVMVGALIDRFWAPGVAALIFVLPILATFILQVDAVSVSFALLIAVFIGLAAGAELDMMAYLTSKYFGPRRYPAVFGGIFAFFTVGAGIGPPIYGSLSQSWGGYNPVLLMSAGILCVSIVLFLMLGRYPSEERREA
ncbi:MAG: MFS transporter [Caulobacterales bacterium]|nr:MFS transporter [Caulobacterales bacterium]